MQEPQPLGFFGGSVGALAPFGVFITGVAWLGLSGAPDERGLWPVLIAAIAIALLLTRDRRRYCDTLLAGMSQPIVMLMLMAWMLAGVLSAVLTAGGLVDALAAAARASGLQGGAYAAAAFLVCCLFSAATGTSLGTLILCLPVLYPAGAPLGADPAILAGAIIGGATFGDNVSPVSDTTIASATTQGAAIGEVVRSRLRYALPAAGVALLGAMVLGGNGDGLPAEQLAKGNGAPLVLLVAPAIVFVLLLRRRHLVEGLLSGIVVALAVGWIGGLLQPSDLLRIEPDAFAARGLVVDGIERALGISVFTLLLMGLVAGIEANGLLDRLVQAATRSARSERGAEAWIFGAVSAAVMLTAHSVVAILAVGAFARQTGERLGIGPARRANLLDTTVCTYPFLFPWFVPTILAASLTASGAATGMPRLDALQVGMANLHSWLLLSIVLMAVFGGYGRRSH
ncbi:MAG TPA: Na+/H+ antiporter NhaC family protein [Acidobacteriota bacterium]|nr:Na+/H+ antiporter NhaC family protein [Acidobacteriota bacterium]